MPLVHFLTKKLTQTRLLNKKSISFLLYLFSILSSSLRLKLLLGSATGGMQQEASKTVDNNPISATSNDELLRSNLAKLKQKIIDTSKLLQLYTNVQNELENAKKQIKLQAADTNNLKQQIEKLQQENGISSAKYNLMEK